MSNNTISEVISTYLKEFDASSKKYANDPQRKYPDPSSQTVKLLRQMPNEALNAIETGLYEKPENLDPRDLSHPLSRLLVTFVDLIPELLISRMTSGYSGSKWTYIQCAAASKSPVFVPIIIDLLTDRSIYIKTLILELIIDCPHLQVPEAMPKFEKLSKMKSFQNSPMDLELLEKARQCVAARL
jgi:hypothetical protein